MRVIQTAMVLTFLVLLSAGSAPAADVAKIGVVDFQRVLETSDAGKAAQEEVNLEGEKMEKDLKAKGSEIEEIEKKLERESMVMSKEMQEQKTREFRIKINDLKGLQKRYMDDFKRLEARIVSRIQKEVFELVKEIGKREGYLLILEKRAGGIVYSPANIDITDQLIKEYNTQFTTKKN